MTNSLFEHDGVLQNIRVWCFRECLAAHVSSEPYLDHFSALELALDLPDLQLGVHGRRHFLALAVAHGAALRRPHVPVGIGVGVAVDGRVVAGGRRLRLGRPSLHHGLAVEGPQRPLSLLMVEAVGEDDILCLTLSPALLALTVFL